MSTTISDDLNSLGTFDTIGEVYAVYPSGGVTGNYVIVDGITLYWDESTLMWTPQGDEGSEINNLKAAVISLQSAVRSLQSGLTGKADLDINDRVKTEQATRVTLRWMGNTIDGASGSNWRVHELFYDEQEQVIKEVTNDIQLTSRILCSPDPSLIYCSQMSGKLYRWDQRTSAWVRVGNDVVNSLNSTATESGLSANQGRILNAALSALNATVNVLSDKINSSAIGDRAKLRVVISDMNYSPGTSDTQGTSVSPIPGGGYNTSPIYASHPSFSGDELLCYSPSDKKLYYYYKAVIADDVTEVRCSVIDPDPMIIYWDASDSDNERVMRWDADNEEWVYNTVYAAITSINETLDTKADADSVYSKLDIDSMLEEKADLEDVYTKDELDDAFDEAATAGSISDAFSTIHDTLSPPGDINSETQE